MEIHMPIEILVPALPESISDATLITWHKKPGDFVNKNENLVDLETDKIVLEVPATESGILVKIIQQDGATVVGGEVLAILETKQTKSTPTTKNPVTKDMPLSPSVRRLIQENNLDPLTIQGSGKKGRLVKTNVLDYLDNKQKQQASKHITDSSLRTEQRVPMTRLREKIAERLLQAQQNSAMLTTFNEINMQSVIHIRNNYKDRFQKKHKIKLGFMSFFVKASVEALKKYPDINASIDGNNILYHNYHDIGIAVSSPKGLVVPTIQDADKLDFAGIEQSISNYIEKAKKGTLSYADLTGGTFTITNGGIFGSMLSTPIINPPQCAILGMHSIKERPVVIDGEIVIRPIMYLALSYDHRLIDGKEAVQFLVTIKESLESPALLLLNL